MKLNYILALLLLILQCNNVLPTRTYTTYLVNRTTTPMTVRVRSYKNGLVAEGDFLIRSNQKQAFTNFLWGQYLVIEIQQPNQKLLKIPMSGKTYELYNKLKNGMTTCGLKKTNH